MAGGTGQTGRHVVAALSAAGHEPVVLARSAGVDVISGEGLERALTEVAAVIDVTDRKTTRRSAALAFFGTASRQLLAAGERAGVRHHIALSIVGIDRVDYGYYAGKLRQEELIRASAVPWTVLRATQFHEFTERFLTAGPVVVAPSMLSRPVAVREVAAALADFVDQGPQGMAPELAGPGEVRMPDAVRRLARARGRHCLVLPVRLPGRAGRQLVDGALLPTGPGPRGRQTFEEWLATAAR
ncbi:SDR family oxidoreductase [Kitasatospora sp. LaBMicrA B282]|uniref:SDR family oxidoreductase n=1 Tax=Kitasatospora sp. LaBMicrA B282 TaxID=3420949 RepID=UPI003D0B7950